MFAMPGGKSKAPLRPVTVLASALAADVNLSNTGAYFDGPSVAQGPVGTWDVTATVTLIDTAGAALMHVKLWDGTTVIDSAAVSTSAASFYQAVTLSGTIANPSGNIRISAKDGTSVSGKIIFNITGNSKDSSITAKRIG